jgi:hypothetical protein
MQCSYVVIDALQLILHLQLYGDHAMAAAPLAQLHDSKQCLLRTLHDTFDYSAIMRATHGIDDAGRLNDCYSTRCRTTDAVVPAVPHILCSFMNGHQLHSLVSVVEG